MINNHQIRKTQRGFTLLEILLVVGIIAILAGIVIVAINPARQLATVRNTERKSDIKQIKSAMDQFYIDHSYYPASTTFPTTLTEICNTGATSSPSGVACDDLIDLSELVPTYITAIPVDPQGSTLAFLNNLIPKAYATTNGTGYKIMKDSTNKIVLTAPQAELDAIIAIGTTTATSSPGGGGLGTDLVAHYKMNDTDGTTAEDTKGNDGTGTYTPTTEGKIGRALSFNGSSNNLTIADSDDWHFGSSDFAIGTWVYLDEADGTPRGIAGLGGGWGGWGNAGNGHEWNFFTYESHLYFQFYQCCDAPVSIISTNTITIGNAWHYVAVVRSGDTITLYLDGNSIGSGGVSVGITRITGGTPHFAISTSAALDSYWKGYVDDFRIYNRALTPDEITELAAGTEGE